MPGIYQPFLTEVSGNRETADYGVSVDPPCPGEATKLCWAGPSWRLLSGPDCVEIEVHDPVARQWQRSAALDATFGRGTLCAGPIDTSGGELLQPPTDRVVLINRLAFDATVVLHASAVRVGDGVCLFCGPSGIGKSTIADLCSRSGFGSQLNDDRAIAFCRDSDVLAGAAPWHGKNPHVDPIPGPLRAVFHLGQAPSNRLCRLSPSDAVARLLAASVGPFYYEPALAALSDTAVRICLETPSFELAFYPDESVLKVVNVALSSPQDGKA